MIRRLIAAIRQQPAPRPHNAPLGSVRPLPDSVRELARNRPSFGQIAPRSPFPLVDANGITWAERKRRQQEA